ncbi:electron transport complex subunit RsxC [Bermanella sp. 47_1433_sub80_T6]|nr:electron transport complex subunit RsxC [Bermanella sp. 47_1433_sub80_T6]
MNMHHFKLYDFDGGIHPEQNKSQSTQLPITTAKIPQRLILPIAQHIGAPGNPAVKPGDKVLKGQIIAKGEDFVSCNLHAPTSGIVGVIEDREVPHQSGMSATCIEIITDGKDTWIDHQGLDNYLESDAASLIDCIAQAGISGMGGAGFPTHVKASIPASKINTLIINAAECEPYITSDDLLMREYAMDIIKGIEILQRILLPEQCYIGIEDNKPQAIEALQIALKENLDDTHNIHVVVIPTKYPSGGEKQLIQILTGKEVPVAGIPADIGIVCQNVGTVHAIYQAVALGIPLISRITTITGDAVSSPQNYQVLLGTPVTDVLSQANAQPNKVKRLIMGGPMMGFTIASADTPITKTSNCIIAASDQELPDPAMEQACIRCGMCTQACPAQLLPQQLYWFAKSSNLEQAQAHNISDCIECGACSYVCPSNIPLVQYYRFAKGEIKQAKSDKKSSEQAKLRFDIRNARLDRETAEKDAKRKARAEAAAKKQAAKKAAPPATPASGDATAEPSVDTEVLKQKVLAAQTRVDKARERLAMAQEQNLETADALELGLNKQIDKLTAAQKSLEEAKS